MNIKKHIFLLSILIIVTASIITAALLFSRKENSVLKIQISETGTLYAETYIDSKSDKIYRIFWETDGGSVSGDDDHDEANYFCYSEPGSNIYWYPRDPDGNIYTCVTIRAYIYEERTYNIFDFSEYEVLASAVLTIELNTETGRPVLSPTQRIFGNPVREGSSNWQEIYQIYENQGDNNNYKILRYRTGNTLSQTDTICWETNAAPLVKAKFTVIPPYSPSTGSANKQFLKNTETVCFDTRRFDRLFFTNEEVRTDGIAQIKISAFAADISGNKFTAEYNFEINTNV